MIKQVGRNCVLFCGCCWLIPLQALADASLPESRDSDSAVLRACAGLFFFGVPNQGIDTQNLKALVKEQKNAGFIASLGEGSKLLKSTHDYFVRAVAAPLGGCPMFSFYETKGTRAVVVRPDGSWSRSGHSLLLVTRGSATCSLPGEPAQQIGIDADHSNMVKFTRRNDPAYRLVAERLAECVRNAESIVGARLESTATEKTVRCRSTRANGNKSK